MNFQNKKIMPRYTAVAIFLTLLAVAAVARAFYIMTAERERWIAMSKINVREGRPLPATRGKILASDGKVLAASLPQYRVYIDFMSYETDSLQCAKDQLRRDTTLEKNLDSIAAGVHRIFPDIDPTRFKAHMRKGRQAKSHYWPLYTADVSSLPLKKRENRIISYVDYSRLKQLPIFNLNSSVNFEKIDTRRRPYGELACRTIGYFNDSARYGLELQFDSVLAGRPGSFHYQKVMNRRVQVVDEPAVDGCDVHTTLDVNFQQICQQALSEKLEELEAISGVCILMEVETGDVKAITSLSRSSSDGTYHEERPLAISDLYEPGSVFKPQSFLVAFDDGKLKVTDHLDVEHGIHKFGNATMKDHNWRNGGYGDLTVPAIIGNSSNVGVSVLIDNAYRDNPAAFVDGLYRIGSAEDLKVPIPGYQKPRIRRPGKGAYWSRTTLPWMSIGYETQVTPINTLTFYNGIAGGGRMVRPRFVTAITRNGETVQEFPVEVLREHMAKPEAIRNIQECLEYVTTRGGGKPAASKLFSVAGKTGTAQIWTGKGRTSEYFVTFAGYFPADAPKYSCIVCIRKAGTAYGGSMCGPVFRKVAEAVMASSNSLDYTAARDTIHPPHRLALHGNAEATAHLFSFLNIQPLSPAAADAPAWGTYEVDNNRASFSPQGTTPKGTMPSVYGYGLRDAIRRLEALGLKVSTNGYGHVCGQSIKAGEPIRRGQRVVLTFSRGQHVAQSPTTPAQPADSTKHDSVATKPEKEEATPSPKTSRE